jgi:alkylation response protein AidB-like acyl-CoA dehydrogenase
VHVHDFRAGVRAWIHARGDELIAGVGQGSVAAQLDHQRRVQRMLFDAGWMRWGGPKRLGGLGGSTTELRRAIGQQLVSAATIPRLVEL